ncbi:arginine--tRNA ligase [Patescibacteria group bacterium]|nr:arginine--tRNA ligase [Patescibacteria group bacterium]
MYTLSAIKANLARLIGETIELEIDASEIIQPPKPEMGDLAFGCFKIAKIQGQSPAEVAKLIVNKINKKEQGIKEIKVEGPYVNFILDAPTLISRVVHEIEEYGEKYGSNQDGGKQQVMIEYANLNSHKEFHVGHLRNILYGLSVHKMLSFAGWDTIPVSYINDMGANVAKCLWLFVRNGSQSINQIAPKVEKGKKSRYIPMPADLWATHVLNNLTKEWVNEMLEAIPLQKRTGKYLGEIYAEATKLSEENEEWKKEISAVHSKLEGHDQAWNFLWQETRRWSIQELYSYLQDFGVVIKRQYLESEFIDQSKKVVQDLLDQGVAIESEGAIIIDFDAYPDPDIQKQKLGVMILRKSDGNLLYATKDIPLAQTKLLEYPKMALSLLVVDTRQAHYFQQLFAALKIMGYKIPLKHLGYEFVTLPEGAMSSRKGTVITFQDFIAKAIQVAKAEVMSRHKDWNDGKIEHTAWCIAMGGIIFTILKQDPEKIIIFEIDKALRFDGDTGPYVQYSLTRLSSILQKSKITAAKLKKAEAHKLDHDAEKQLALCLARLPEVCSRAAKEYKPSIIAQWCLEAASLVNAFYRDVQVIDATPEIRDARLKLVSATKVAMQNALTILGIPFPDSM